VKLIVPNAYGPHDYLDEQRTHAMNGIIMRMIKSKMSGQQESLPMLVHGHVLHCCYEA
jgi:hypothetical protein